VDADNNPVDASILKLGDGQQTKNLKLWYYLDKAVKNGEKYQYGIVTTGYKNANDVVVKSEIAWQDETDTNKYAAANKPAVGSKFSVPAFPEVKIDLINSVTPGISLPAGSEDVADKMLVTISGLDPFYKYTLYRQYSNDGTEANYGTDGGDLVSDIWGVDEDTKLTNYLETGTTIIKQYDSGWDDGPIATGEARRLVVKIDVASSTDYVLEYTTRTTSSVLQSNEKSWAIAKK
jgi:hypothetical protein